MNQGQRVARVACDTTSQSISMKENIEKVLEKASQTTQPTRSEPAEEQEDELWKQEFEQLPLGQGATIHD
jgi:hypothetical protein